MSQKLPVSPTRICYHLCVASTHVQNSWMSASGTHPPHLYVSNAVVDSYNWNPVLKGEGACYKCSHLQRGSHPRALRVANNSFQKYNYSTTYVLHLHLGQLEGFSEHLQHH
jgi:hypothetical protein